MTIPRLESNSSYTQPSSFPIQFLSKGCKGFWSEILGVLQHFLAQRGSAPNLPHDSPISCFTLLRPEPAGA